MEDELTLEGVTLREALRSGEPVKIFFTNGHQVMATIVDYDDTAIRVIAHVKEVDRHWMIYRHAVSTIQIR